MTELKRQLGLLDSTMINAGTIIASAIFIVPSVIALHLGASLPTLLVWVVGGAVRSEEHTSELQSPDQLVCRLLPEKKHHVDAPHERGGDCHRRQALIGT